MYDLDLDLGVYDLLRLAGVRDLDLLYDLLRLGGDLLRLLLLDRDRETDLEYDLDLDRGYKKQIFLFQRHIKNMKHILFKIIFDTIPVD